MVQYLPRFESRAADGLAAGFDNADGGEMNLRLELRTAHPLPIAVNVLEQSANSPATASVATKGAGLAP